MKAEYLPPKGILIYTIEGKIDKFFMDELKEVQAKIPRNQAFKILAIVPEFRGYKSLKAAKKALLFDLKIFQNLSHYAMVSDLVWLKSIAKIISVFLPRVSFRFFDLNDKDLAMEWLKK